MHFASGDANYTTMFSIQAFVTHVVVTDTSLVVQLSDGRQISVPLAFYPRLMHGTPAERAHWELIGRGTGIHWPDLDEDISVESICFGWRSQEGQASLARWLAARKSANDDDTRR